MHSNMPLNLFGLSYQNYFLNSHPYNWDHVIRSCIFVKHWALDMVQIMKSSIDLNHLDADIEYYSKQLRHIYRGYLL